MMFFLINLILFLLGTFMDMASTILICTPLFLPLAIQMGMGPVQFGMVMLLNCALGLNTPPVGTTQFVGCAIGEVSVEQVMKSILPFYGALFAGDGRGDLCPRFLDLDPEPAQGRTGVLTLVHAVLTSLLPELGQAAALILEK
jgi:hypothetical protein